MSDIFQTVKDNVPILSLIKKYDIDTISEGRNVYKCNCVFHSESTNSLAIYATTNSFYCFGAGCNASGDVINFVSIKEKISPIDAALKIAKDFGLNIPEVSPKDSSLHAKKFRYTTILTAATEYYQSHMTEPIYDYIKKTWGITKESAAKFKLGYAPVENELKSYLTEKVSITKEEAKSCGLFAGQDSQFEFYNGRIVIPYITGGYTYYFSGRATHKTPQNKYEYDIDATGSFTGVRKYKKLPRNDMHSQDMFFNEDILKIINESTLVISEGLMDVIMCDQCMVPAITFGGTKIPDSMLKRLLASCYSVDTICICYDTDHNGAGQMAANSLARRLMDSDKSITIVELPTGEDGAKQDICSYVMTHSETDLSDVIKRARTLIELEMDHIDSLEKENATEKFKKLNPILKLIAKCDPITKNAYIEVLAKKTKINKKFINEAMKDSSGGEEMADINLGGSLKRILNQMRANKRYTFADISDVTYKWFENNGGQFFVDKTSQPYLLMNNIVYNVDSKDRRFLSLMCDLGEYNQYCGEGKYVIEHLTNMSCIKGKKIESYSWEYTDFNTNSIFLNLNNDHNQIVRISPNEIEVMDNGLNGYKILLANDERMSPIYYDENVDIEEGKKLIKELLFDNLSCRIEDRYLILAWILSYPMLEFAQTKPLMRLEGNSSSGKSTAAKLITSLLYGQPQLKTATAAANYSSASKTPLACFDNIEQRELTQALSQYLITSATGIQREKRKTGTESGVITEKGNCLNLSTGIESLAGAELLNRTFIIQFKERYKKPGFIETKILNDFRLNHSKIMSTLFKIWSNKVLPVATSKKFQDLAIAMQLVFKPHSKSRAIEYLTLMTVIASELLSFLPAPEDSQEILRSVISRDVMLKYSNGDEETKWLDLAPIRLVGRWIFDQNTENTDTQIGSNTTSVLLDGLYYDFMAIKKALSNSDASAEDKMLQEYTVSFKTDYDAENKKIFKFRATSKNLFMAFSKYSKNKGLLLPFNTPHQLGRRLSNDKELLERSGWRIDRVERKSGQVEYEYKKVVHEQDNDPDDDF